MPLFFLIAFILLGIPLMLTGLWVWAKFLHHQARRKVYLKDSGVDLAHCWHPYWPWRIKRFFLRPAPIPRPLPFDPNYPEPPHPKRSNRR